MKLGGCLGLLFITLRYASRIKRDKQGDSGCHAELAEAWRTKNYFQVALRHAQSDTSIRLRILKSRNIIRDANYTSTEPLKKRNVGVRLSSPA